MPADKQLGWLCHECFSDGRVVLPGITSDVFDEYVGTFQLETVDFWKAYAQVLSVDVAIDSSQWTKIRQTFGYFQ